MINSIFNPDNYFFNIHSISYFISGIIITAESIFVYLQNRRSMLNASFAIATLFAGIWLTGNGFTYSSSSESLAFMWARYCAWLGVIFITPSVYLLSAIWEGTPSRKRTKFIYFNFATGFIFYIICISTTFFIQGVWSYSWGFYPKAAIMEGPFIIWFYTLMVLSFRNFIRSYKEEKILIRKKQTKLVIIAFVLGFIGSLDFLPNYGIPSYAAGGMFALVFSTIIGYTIVNYKLMEIETVIHKTIAWFFTSVALVVPLAALLYFSKAWYTKLSPFGAWSYFGVVLLCFLFFVKFFQPKVDNFFQRGKVYLENVLNKFSDELVHLRSLDEVINKITDTITEIIPADKVTILLYNDRLKKLVTVPFRAQVGSTRDSLKVDMQLDPEEPFLKWLSKNDRVLNRKFIEIDPRYEPIRPQAKQYFQKLKAIMCIPLVLNERLIGLVNLGQKTNLKSFSPLEHQFLTRLKNQSTIAISNSLAYDRVEEMVKIRTEELVQAQQQLIQAEKLATIGTLSGGVAHEINNPLAAIMTNAQMLQTSKVSEEDKESIDLIEEAAKRCRSIIQKLMVYSRKPVGTREISQVDLHNVLNNAVSFLSYQLQQENVKIIPKIDNPPFILKGCQNELEQVLTNLILNARDAIKSVKKGGNIEISLSKLNSRIMVKVKDEGPGISKEHIQKIFDPFFTTKEVGKGTGLGLSICQSIIEQHNGTIRAESKPNEGATFVITLGVTKGE